MLLFNRTEVCVPACVPACVLSQILGVFFPLALTYRDFDKVKFSPKLSWWRVNLLKDLWIWTRHKHYCDLHLAQYWHWLYFFFEKRQSQNSVWWYFSITVFWLFSGITVWATVVILELFDYLHLGFHFEFPNWTSVRTVRSGRVHKWSVWSDLSVFGWRGRCKAFPPLYHAVPDACCQP